MDGSRTRKLWSDEAKALVSTYRNFETLLPSASSAGAAHTGEDGRYVESLIRTYLRKYLPSDIELFSGFIMRPAVKTGRSSKARRRESDAHSSQLDIIAYETAAFPVYQRFEDAAVVPPEGVLGVISVKKHLRDADIKRETTALREAGQLCRVRGINGRPQRGPFLALAAAGSEISKATVATEDWVFGQLRDAYSGGQVPYFDETIGYIGSLSDWSIFKKRPPSDGRSAEYVYFERRDNEEHLALQFLLTGLLSVFYDDTRRPHRRPGFTGFESGRWHDRVLGSVATLGLREGA